jgi:hypothetical protein
VTTREVGYMLHSMGVVGGGGRVLGKGQASKGGGTKKHLPYKRPIKNELHVDHNPL